MAHRLGKYTLAFDRPPRVISFAAVGGKKEGEGPLGNAFDRIFTDAYLGKDSFEEAESELQRQALTIAMSKGEITPDKVQYLFAGDLLNQCVGSTMGVGSFGIPQVGIYGACSTMALGLVMASGFVEGGLAQTVGAVTSSHFCASERQFRFPLEYGGQRPQTAGWTATASGALVLGDRTAGVAVTHGIVGRVTTLGVTDANNMGAAMAPAAADTILHFFEDTHMTPDNFDLIMTGDLGKVGSRLLCELTRKKGLEISHCHADCGLNLYHEQEQDVHAGGSGCGCCAAVLCARILPSLSKGELKRVLFVATGSLHSTTTVQQGLPISGIAHGVVLSAE